MEVILDQAVTPLVSAQIDYVAATALLFGALFGFLVSALLFGCECCGLSVVVIWRSCMVVHVKGSEREQRLPLVAPRSTIPTCFGIRPSMCAHASNSSSIQLRQDRLRGPAMLDLPQADTAVWNRLREAIGPDVPDSEIANLIDRYGADTQAAMQSYFDMQSSRRRRER